MQLNEIPDVVSNENPFFRDGNVKLLLIPQASAASMDGADRVVPSIAKDFSQEGSNIFVQVESYRRHADSVCWRINLSRSAR